MLILVSLVLPLELSIPITDVYVIVVISKMVLYANLVLFNVQHVIVHLYVLDVSVLEYYLMMLVYVLINYFL